MRICDAVGLHHRGPHLYRRVTELYSRHSYLFGVANLANVVGRNRCRMSREYAEIQQSGRGKFEKVGEKGVRNCDAVVLHLLHRGRHLYERVIGLGRMDRIRSCSCLLNRFPRILKRDSGRPGRGGTRSEGSSLLIECDLVSQNQLP